MLLDFLKFGEDRALVAAVERPRAEPKTTPKAKWTRVDQRLQLGQCPRRIEPQRRANFLERALQNLCEKVKNPRFSQILK